VLYAHVGDRFLRGRKSFMHVIVLGLVLVLVIMHHEVMLAVLFNGFMLLGLFNEIRYQLLPSHRPKEWVQATEPLPPIDEEKPATVLPAAVDLNVKGPPQP